MYNAPIEFHGDIIITDPCYIVKDDEIDMSSCPSWWDYLSKQTEKVVDGVVAHNYPKASDYPDCKRTFLNSLDISEEKAQDFIKSGILPESFFYGDVSETLKKEEDEFSKAYAAWTNTHTSDWDKCDCGENMGALGFTNFLCGDTLYGDWSCHVIEEGTKKDLGSFSADAGMVGVFLLDEVLKYDPNFVPDFCSCVIKDFHGIIELQNMGDDVKVVGRGNINFHSYQAGF